VRKECEIQNAELRIQKEGSVPEMGICKVRPLRGRYRLCDAVGYNHGTPTGRVEVIGIADRSYNY